MQEYCKITTFVSNNMVAVTTVDIVHIYSNFFEQSSDHDPILIQTELVAK